MHQQQQSQHQCPVDIASTTKPTSVHIHTSNNRASISVQYTFIPATTEPASGSITYSYQKQQSQHQCPVHIIPATTEPASWSSTHSYQQQHSQHQGPIHIHTSSNRARIRVQYTFIPATTEPASESSTHSYQQRQSQHQHTIIPATTEPALVHIHTNNNRASIRVQYTVIPATTEPASGSSTQSYQQQQSQHQGPVHSHTSVNRATTSGRSSRPLKLSCIILVEVEIV